MKKVMVVLAVLLGSSLSQAALGAVTAKAQSEPMVVLAAPVVASDTEGQEDPLYAKGSKAMDEQRWNDAVAAFDEVVAAKSKRADAALYWKAYSLEKLSKKDDAKATCIVLRKQQPASTWNRECMVLEARTMDVDALREMARVQTLSREDMKMRFDGGPNFMIHMDGKGRTTNEEDIKLLALNSLMRQDPAKALPLLREIVKSDKSMAMRRQALFVLSRSKDPQALTILTEVANTKGNPEFQAEAIQMLALKLGKDAGPQLVEFYRGSSDAEVKRAAISGLYIAHDAPRLVELARGEKDLNLKKNIVSQLAVMKDQAASDYMLELLK